MKKFCSKIRLKNINKKQYGALVLIGGLLAIVFIPNWCIIGKNLSTARTGTRNYDFDGNISREVLESYLSRSITYTCLLDRQYLEGWAQGNVSDGIRSVTNMGAKFIGRVLFTWNSEKTLLTRMDEAKEIEAAIHAIDPDIILQACVFEAVSINVEYVPIPAWVFEEFDLTPEDRNFSFPAMYEVGGEHEDFWGENSAVPDMSKLETRMWCFFLAASYIDLGIEAIHFGQVHLMSKNDPHFENWWDLLARVRVYAKDHARRHLLICDAHTHGIVSRCHLMFDFHSFPQRPEEISKLPQEAELKNGHSDSIFKDSAGGITPSGWLCDSLPYLVEFDNFGNTDTLGQDTGGIWVWGYDEITWYAHQPEEYRNNYLWYASRWLENNDPNGFLQMPGSRPLAELLDNATFYFANTQSDACPYGFNQESTIKSIWTQTPNFYLE